MLATRPALVASLGGGDRADRAGGPVLRQRRRLRRPAGRLTCPRPALRRFRRATRWALFGPSAATVVAYVAVIQGHVDALGLAAKAVEPLLIVLLLIEDRRPH